MRLLPILLVAILLGGCDSDAAPENVLGGDYEATLSLDDGVTLQTLFQIPETPSGEAFSFRYVTIRRDGPVTVGGNFRGAGTYDHPAVTLSVDDDETVETITGTVIEDGAAIRLTPDPGEEPVVLRRR